MKTGISRATKKCDCGKICILGRGNFCEYDGTNNLVQLRPLPQGEWPKVPKIVKGAADFNMIGKGIEMLLSPKDS